ncbi:kinase-like protein, partial [Aspergillus sclerotioniger CBS 115572]
MIRHSQILKRVISSSLLLTRSQCAIPTSTSFHRPHKLHSGFPTRSSSTMASDRIEYNWIEDVETLEFYQPGGYHPVMIGDTLHNRYLVVDKLGSGGYSTVWLAHDTSLKHYVTLKVNIADALPNEAKVLKALSTSLLSSSPVHLGRDLVPAILDEFEVQDLREISFSRLFPIDVARALCYGLVQAVAYTHSQGHVHGDIHLGNIMIKLSSRFNDLSVKECYGKYGEPETVPITRCDGKPLTPNVPTHAVLPLFLGKYAETFTLADVRLLLGDFGEAFAPNSEVRLGEDCHAPPAFRAPETYLESKTPLTYSSDIWSLATAIWEIVGMKPIFSNEFIPHAQIVAQHVDVLGQMPGECKYFDEDGGPTDSYRAKKWPPLEESFEIDIQKWRRKWRGEIKKDEKKAFLDLIRRMLMFRPEDRLTAEDVLQSEWRVKWAFPEYKRSLDTSV